MLEAAHRVLAPRTYFEIGTRTGRSLALARCPAIAVDPAFRLESGFAEARPDLRLFPMTSDDFFAAHDPAALFGAPIELGFLDGMHCFEFLLRDFINAERFATPASVLVLHDCAPFSSAIVDRAEFAPRVAELDVMPRAWAGDVWKLLPILRDYRPDLTLAVFDCPPTGLVFVSGLDPSSRRLSEAYEEIVARYMDSDITALSVTAFNESLGIRRSRRAMAEGDAALARHLAPGRVMA